MDFGRREDLDGVSFALPEPPSRTARVLARGRPGGDERWLRVGAPAWSRRDWVGKLYPAGAPQRDWLRLYAARVQAIELNATFYALPDEATVDGWCDETPDGFHFCPKLSQAITHERGLRGVEREAAAFFERVRRLGPRLGTALLQLPPGFAPDALPVLDAFLALRPAGVRLAVELRHAAWFAGGGLREDAADVLERRGAAAAITDVAGRRDACHATLTAPEVMVRFVGNALHPTDAPRVDAWMARLCAWRARGLERAYFFVHQPDDVLAPELMAIAVERARARGVALPPLVLGAGQLSLF